MWLPFCTILPNGCAIFSKAYLVLCNITQWLPNVAQYWTMVALFCNIFSLLLEILKNAKVRNHWTMLHNIAKPFLCCAILCISANTWKNFTFSQPLHEIVQKYNYLWKISHQKKCKTFQPLHNVTQHCETIAHCSALNMTQRTFCNHCVILHISATTCKYFIFRQPLHYILVKISHF